MYKVIQGSHGPRYMKDGKFVKKANIPPDTLIQLNVGMQDIDTTPVEPEIHKCVFCDQVTKRYRLLNQKNIYVCEEDYQDKTVGQTVQQANLKGI